MASKDIDIKLKLDAKQADKDLKGIKDDLDELDEPTTVKVDADTADAETGLKTVDELSDRLASNDTVIDIKADIDKAKADLDSVETKLHGLDDAASATGTKIGHDIGEGAGEARGRMSELVGESVAELPGIGEALGPAGEALSSLTEGFLGGELALKDLVLAGGGMAAVTLAFKVLGNAMEANKNIDAFNKKKVEDFTKALREGKTALEQLNEEFADTGKVEFVDAADGKTKDLIGTLADANIQWDEFLGKVNLGKDGFKQWVIANGEAISATSDLNAVIQAGNQFIDDRAEAEKAWNDQQEVMGVTQHETDRETRRLNAAFEEGTDSIDHNREATRKATVQIDKFKEQTALADGAYRHLIGALDEQDAWANVNQAILDYNENTKHSDQDTRDLIRTVADYVNETDTIPESKKTEVFAVLATGDVEKIEATMEQLTRQRDIKILLTAVGSQDIIDKLTLKGAKADGTPYAAQGSYLVGERGPEIVNLPGGSEVIPNHHLGSIGGPVTIIQHFPPGISPTAVAKANKEYRRRGGRAA